MSKIIDGVLGLVVLLGACIGITVGIAFVPLRAAWETSGWMLEWALGADWAEKPAWVHDKQRQP